MKMKKKNKTQTTYEEVEKYCKEEYRARYLKNRDRAIVNVLLKHYPEMSQIPKEKLIVFVSEAQTYARSFRKVLEDHPEWTNEIEKENKVILEQRTQLDLGYSPGHNQDVEKLSTL